MRTTTTRRSPKLSNVVTVDFAKGRLLPGPQKPAGMGNDLILHSLKRLAVDQRAINERLHKVLGILAAVDLLKELRR